MNRLKIGRIDMNSRKDESGKHQYEEEIKSAQPVSTEERGTAFLKTRKGKLSMVVGVFFILLLLLGLHLSGLFEFGEEKEKKEEEMKESLKVLFREPVMLPREKVWLGQNTQIYPEGAIGYEPSIDVDSSGAMFYTAHKDLAWQESWDYTASWWFISTDGGKTWRNPDDIFWNTEGKYLWPGDEGDIAVDAQDRIYYVDTYLEDNNFHVFSNHGDTYLYSKRLQSTLLDDRPWIAAQGDGIVHYLGNNGISIGQGRYWYYRSTDGGLTFTLGKDFRSGWATIDAERLGNHVYIAHEGSDAENNPDVFLYYSDDQGATWNWDNHTYVGPMKRNGVGEGFPIVAAGVEGRVFVIWQDSPQAGNGPATLYFARSEDYGRSFEYWNISMPEGAIYLYPTVDVSPYRDDNLVGVAFYATTDIPVNAESKWYLYAAVALDPKNGTKFQFQKADQQVVYTGDDLHALHDFFEIVIAPDGSINIAYQINVGEHPYEAGEEQRYLMFVRGDVEGLQQ